MSSSSSSFSNLIPSASSCKLKRHFSPSHESKFLKKLCTRLDDCTISVAELLHQGVPTPPPEREQSDQQKTVEIPPPPPPPPTNTTPEPNNHNEMKSRRFLLGYQPDCLKCRLRIPGHYAHVLTNGLDPPLSSHSFKSEHK